MEFQAQLEQGLAAIGDKLDSKLKEVNESTVKASAKAMSEVNDLGKQLAEMQTELTTLAQKGFQMPASKEQASLGSQFVGSDSFKSFASGQASRANFTFQANTVLSGKDDVIVPYDRRDGVVPGAFRQLSILDFVNKGTTTQDTVRYTKETAFTNNSAETAQGAQKPESDITFEAVNAPVQTIPTSLKISKQVMDDAPAVESYINNRLRHGVRQRLDSQIINGDGLGTNLSGILQNSTAVAVGASANAFDYTNLGKYSVMGADYMPDFWFVNPADWGSEFETVKRGAADAAYVGASGAVTYVNNGLTPLLWGLPVVASNAVPAGTVIGGSSDAMMLWMRDDVNIQAFEQDENNVQLNLVTIRAEMRAAFTVFRDDALITLDLSTLPA